MWIVDDNTSSQVTGPIVFYPSVAIKKEMEEVTGDKTIPDNEKKQMLDDLKEALKAAQPIQYPTNIELVTKYFDKLDAVLQ